MSEQDESADDVISRLEGALADRKTQGYVLCLYVSGLSRHSLEAIKNIRQICDEYLHGQYELDIVDIYQQPELASEGHVVAVPTLVKSQPLPCRRLIGDLSDRPETLQALGISKNDQ